MRASSGLIELAGNEPGIKAMFIGMAGNPPEPLSKCLCIAMLAARADLSASTNRVPGGVSPFDLRVVAHDV